MTVYQHPQASRTVGPGFLERRRRTGLVLSILLLLALGVGVGAAVGAALAEILTTVLSHVKTDI
ncbi:hypothetical protein [Nocardioides campestrisoli]|uniref:hypothetical protein n=1 Tax=Nocardioides campestrisoli TaxID=2736757 RepID=UPI0015E6AB29|nr:hypothetical protein [Nocardioides campestrisoli]